MPAKVSAATGFGVVEIQFYGFLPTEEWLKFVKKGWKWHPTVKKFTKKYIENGVSRPLEVEKEAQDLVKAYNNRFDQAA